MDIFSDMGQVQVRFP